MMKKGYILMAVMLMAALGPVSAQQFRFGVEAGGTISKSTWEFSGGQKTKSVGGYIAGIAVEYEIYDNAWLQSGLLFGTKGAKYKVAKEAVPGHQNVFCDRTETYRPMYIHLPVTIAYKFKLTSRVRFFVSAGGFLSQGISGEYNKKLSYSGDGSKGWDNENKNESVFSTDALKRFDCGLNVGGGFEFGRLTLRVGHDWSLLNIAKDKAALGADEFKNRSINIALGLKFGN